MLKTLIFWSFTFLIRRVWQCTSHRSLLVLMKSTFKKSCYFSACLGTEGIATLGTSCWSLRSPYRLQNATAAKDSGKVDKYFFHSCRSVKTPQLWTACTQESTTLKGKGFKSLHCVKLIFCPCKLWRVEDFSSSHYLPGIFEICYTG